MIAPPRRTGEQLKAGIQAATVIFRRERMHEPLQSYLDAFAHYEAAGNGGLDQAEVARSLPLFRRAAVVGTT
jgi:hypothetical protein